MKKKLSHEKPGVFTSVKRTCLITGMAICLMGIINPLYAEVKEPSTVDLPVTEVINQGVVQQANITVTGVVTDEFGDPVIGASIIVDETKQGTITSIDGDFSVSAPADGTLTFSYIGYLSQKVKINNRTLINIIMKEDTQTLDEVVVVGYGSQKKVNLTGAVAAVKIDENIASRTLSNVSSGLSGLIPGLMVQQTSGFAGFSGAALQIRGLGSVNDASPLVVVDGMPDVDINRINMNDIESISVLKDAASSAVYGSRAANGVILITTKTGKGQSKPKLSYTGSYAAAKISDFYPYLDDYSRAMTLQMRASGSGNQSSNFREGAVEQWLSMSLVDPILFPNTNQYDEMFRTGNVWNHTVSASGSGDRYNFYISAGIMNEEGLQINNNYKRYNARFNLDYKIRDNFTVGMKVDGQWSETKYPRGAGLESAGLKYAVSGILNKHPETGEYGGAMGYGENSSAGNMLAEYELYFNERERQEFNGTVYANWEMIKGLSVNVSYALRYYNQFTKSWTTPTATYNFQTGEVARVMPASDDMSNDIKQGHKTLFQGRINYEREIVRGHQLSVMFAAAEEYWFDRSLWASRNDKLYPTLTELDAASAAIQQNSGYSDSEGLRSFIGRLNYTLYDRYLLEANFRYDGSSKFAKGHQYGFFPSIALGWRVSEEAFFINLKDIFNNVKVRASLGSLGNNKGVGRYEQKNTMQTTNYIVDGNIVTGFSANKMINPDLTWESTRVFNLGLDLGFFSNRLTAELDYYDRLTTDMIRPSDFSTLLTGYSAPRRNIGNLRNRGVEANVNWRSNIGKVNYQVNVNASFNRNNLEEWNEYLSRGWTFLDMPYHFVYSYVAYPGLAQSWTDIYNAPYQNNGNFAPGDILYEDLNGDGRITDQDRKAFPNRLRDQPSGSFGFSIGAQYMGFDISTLWQGSYGKWDFWLDDFNNVNVPSNRFGFLSHHWNDSWSLDNRSAYLPRLVTGSAAQNRLESTYWLQNTSYLRMKNIQIGYSIPTNILKKISIDRTRIFFSAENLLTFTSWKGVDPEKPKYDSKNNTDFDLYPAVKTISVGINLEF